MLLERMGRAELRQAEGWVRAWLKDNEGAVRKSSLAERAAGQRWGEFSAEVLAIVVLDS
jgi:hypothetical protein